MRDPARIDVICQALAKAWKQYPDERLGQFLENYIFPTTQTLHGGTTALTFFQEDEKTLKKIEAHTTSEKVV